MFISVDLPAPFSPSSAWTSPLRRSKFTLSLASTPGNRFVIPRSSRRGASAIARAILSGGTQAARQLLCRRASTHGDVGRDPGIEVPYPDRTARGAEHNVLAASVDAGDRIPEHNADRDVRQLEVRDLEPDAVLLVRTRNRRLGAHTSVSHHDDRTARDRTERCLLARGGKIGRPGAQDDRAPLDVPCAAHERCGERSL